MSRLLALLLLALAAPAGVLWLAPSVLWPDYDAAEAALDAMMADASTDWRADPARSAAALALVAQEDERLFRRTIAGGSLPVDGRACARAVARNAAAGRVVEGCSTLPMQVAKLAIPEEARYTRSVSRKLLQLRLSAALLGTAPDRIIDAFLSNLPCGSSIAEGFDQCALLHFGRPAADLNEAEAVVLATSVQAPSRHLLDDERTQQRLDRALLQLGALGWLDPRQLAAIAAQPLRRSGLHPEMVRAASGTLDLELTAGLGAAVAAARARAIDKQGSDDDLIVLGMVFDADGSLAAVAGAEPSWMERPIEAGSWVKPFCAASLLDLPGAGADYLTRTEIPIALPLRDRQLRRYTPGNVGSDPPARATPMEYIARSVNTASLATMLYAHVYLPPDTVGGHLSQVLTASERRRYRTATDRRLSLELASRYAGFPLSAADAPDLPGYREMSLSSVRTCLATMRRHVPELEVPHEDLAALLGVVRAPAAALGAGAARLWLTEDGEPTQIASLMRQYGRLGTLASTVRQLDTDLTYKTATATRNAGLLVVLPLEDDAGQRRSVVLALVAVRPGGGDIEPLFGSTLSPGIPAFLDRLEADGTYTLR